MSATRYPVPAETLEHRLEARRSRFIARLARVDSEAAMGALLDITRDRNPGAGHYCRACLLGAPGDLNRAGASDDGEPAGTAGSPMLQVLAGSGVGEVGVVVARFFGGTRLGRGGLVRAYSGVVREALEGLSLRERVERRRVAVELDYPDFERLRNVLGELDVTLDEVDFGARVRARLGIPADGGEALAAALSSLGSAGNALARQI